VVLSSCDSRAVASAFLDAGALHVADTAARKFAYAFYHSLLVGNSIKQSFKHACWLVRHSPEIPSPQQESNKFVLLPAAADHSEVLFSSLPTGLFVDRSIRRATANLPHINMDLVVGRQVEMWEVSRAIQSPKRFIVIVGAPGIGKSTLACVVAQYAWKRNWFPEGVSWMPLKGLKWVEGVSGTACSTLGASSDPDTQQPLPHINGKRLIVFDNAEDLLRRTPRRFLAWVVQLLDSCPHLKILLTSRRIIKPADLPEKCPLVPKHIHLGELDRTNSVRLLRQLCPNMDVQPAARTGDPATRVACDWPSAGQPS